MRISGLSVAMVQPKYSLNVGYVARVMSNFGLERLIIIDRKRLGLSSFVFASHGRDILENVDHMSWQQVLGEFDFIIGTTAIATAGRNPLRSTLSPEKLGRLNFEPSKSVLVLGRDDTGLTKQELAHCDVILSVSTGTSYRTLNISHALAIILYALNRTEGVAFRRNGINRKLKDTAMNYVDNLLIKTGFIDSKKLEVNIILKKLFNESYLNENQFSVILGFLRRLDRKLN
jgi:TrmH family RNA methyltransferase